MAEDKIDENILPLVNYINGLIGLYTDHSCGGHENPKSWQENEGEFYVCFRTKHEPPTKSEWANIRFLVTKAWNFTQGNSCERKTRVEMYCPPDQQMHYKIFGKTFDLEELVNDLPEHLK